MNALRFLIFSFGLAAQTYEVGFQSTVAVADDAGAPIQGALVGFAWDIGPLLPLDYASHQNQSTGAAGTALFVGSTKYPVYRYSATKIGYYPTYDLEGRFDLAAPGASISLSLPVVLKK